MLVDKKNDKSKRWDKKQADDRQERESKQELIYNRATAHCRH
jgi:hypothetical protein